MRCQTSYDQEEVVRFDNNAGFDAPMPRLSRRTAGKAEHMTADQWLDRYAGWCESYKARISSFACKLRQNSELSDFCKGCKGVGKKKENYSGGTYLRKRILS